MNYEFWFWILLTFVVARTLPRTFYIGYDEQKYNAAECGILLGSDKE